MSAALSAHRLPEGRAGHALALALLLATIATIALAIVAPVLAQYDARHEALTQRRETLARMQALVDRLPSLRTALAESHQAHAPLLAGDTDGLAAASLQETLQDLARTAGIGFGSIAPLPASQLGRQRRIGLRVATTAPFPALIALMARIETANPRMLIEDLQLHTAAILPLGQAAATPPLDASFSVIGFRAAAAAP